MPQPFADIAWPDTPSYRIANARVPLCFVSGPHGFAPQDRDDGTASLDILIGNGRIERLAPAGAGATDPRPSVDLNGRQVWPMLIDAHTHLDRGHTVVRSPNASGTFKDAVLATAADRPKWTHEDLLTRMDFGIRCAYAHGVAAIRTHLDSVPEQAQRSWPAFREMREQWKGRVALQAVSLLPIDFFRGEWGDQLAKLVAESGGVLGAVTRAAAASSHGAPLGDLDELLDRLFGLAAIVKLSADDADWLWPGASPDEAARRLLARPGLRVARGRGHGTPERPRDGAGDA